MAGRAYSHTASTVAGPTHISHPTFFESSFLLQARARRTRTRRTTHTPFWPRFPLISIPAGSPQTPPAKNDDISHPHPPSHCFVPATANLRTCCLSKAPFQLHTPSLCSAACDLPLPSPFYLVLHAGAPAAPHEGCAARWRLRAWGRQAGDARWPGMGRAGYCCEVREGALGVLWRRRDRHDDCTNIKSSTKKRRRRRGHSFTPQSGSL